MINKELVSKGLLWTSGVCAGIIIGGGINERLNQKYVVPSVKRYRDLAETFQKQLLIYDNEIMKLKKKLKEEEEA